VVTRRGVTRPGTVTSPDELPVFWSWDEFKKLKIIKQLYEYTFFKEKCLTTMTLVLQKCMQGIVRRAIPLDSGISVCTKLPLKSVPHFQCLSPHVLTGLKFLHIYMSFSSFFPTLSEQKCMCVRGDHWSLATFGKVSCTKGVYNGKQRMTYLVDTEKAQTEQRHNPKLQRGKNTR